MGIDDIRDLVRERVASRPVILTGTIPSRFRQQVHELRSLDADRVLIVTNGPDTEFSGDGFHHLALDLDTGKESSGIEPAWRRIFEDTPPEVQAAVDRFDPHGDAVVIPWRLRRSTVFAGRPIYGPRHPSAIALEDKTRFVELLEDLGIPQPPGSITVKANLDDLVAASKSFDWEDGVVWSGDSATVSASGGKYIRHVKNLKEAGSAARFFENRCDAVRVSPFVEGVSGGIHAIVNREHTVVFRPTEQIVMRGKQSVPFELIGLATMFDPHPYDREQYREMTRVIGNEMYRRLGYEGLISVDAILSKHGWVVHDLNPRPSAGLIYLKQVLPDLPIQLFHHVVAEGDAQGLDWHRIEQQVCAAADLRRVAIASMRVPAGPDGARVVRVHNEHDEHIDVHFHPRERGGDVTFRIDTIAGEPVAPKVAAAMNAASEWLGLGVQVAAAESVRERPIEIEPIEEIHIVQPDDLVTMPPPVKSHQVVVPEPEREPEHVITLERGGVTR